KTILRSAEVGKRTGGLRTTSSGRDCIGCSGRPRALVATPRRQFGYWRCLRRSDRPTHPESNFAIQCEYVCLSPSNRKRLPLPNCFGVVGPTRARSTRVLPPAPGRISRRDPLRTGNETRPLPWATGLMEERYA